MGRTVNRMPTQVDVPSGKDIKQYFFNQYKWKGINDDKNFLTSDQETFVDANNVYVDTEGLLKSRPSLKIKTAKYTNSGVEYVLSNIIDVWTFEYVTVYQTLVDGIYYLTFVNSKVKNHIQVPLTYLDANEESKTYKDVKLIVADTKIFVFSEYAFNYYDIKENIYANAVKFIHIPVTSVVTDGLVNASVKVESPNVLTTSYITKYLYTSTENLNFDNLVGKQVKVEIDGITYNIDWQYNNQIALVSRYTGLSEYNFADEYILGKHGKGTPLVCASETDSMLVCSYTCTINETTKKPIINWIIYHTVDGIIFDKLPDISGVLGAPKLSRDGIYCFVFKSDGPYVYSVLKENGLKKYNSWTNLLKSINESEYTALNLNLNQTNETGSYFNQTTVVNGYFRDDKVFAFTYGDNLTSKSGDPRYYNLHCVYSRGNEHIYRKDIFNKISGSSYSLSPSVSSYTTDPISFTSTSFGVTSTTTVNTSNNIPNRTFSYSGNGKTATATVTNLVYTNRSTINTLTGAVSWGAATLTGHLRIVDNENNVIADRNISFSRSNYAPVTSNMGHITSYNSWTSNDSYFTYEIKSVSNGQQTSGPSTIDLYKQTFKITAKTISDSTADSGTKVPAHNSSYFAYTDGFMPNLYVGFESDTNKISIAIDFSATLLNVNPPYAPYYRAIYHIDDAGTQVAEILSYHTYGSDNTCRAPIKDACIVNNRRYTFVRLYLDTEHTKYGIYVNTIQLANNSDDVANAIINTQTKIFEEAYTSLDQYYNEMLVLSDPQTYLLTNKYLFDYLDYTSNTAEYTPIPLLFEAKPIAHYYSGNTKDCLYIATENAVYANSTNNVITVSELTEGKVNYFLPEHDALLSNYYFSKDNKLYILSPAVQLNVNTDKTISEDKIDFEWYLPEINKQEFDFNITNLHAISDTEVAIFFEHSVSYVNWDNDAQAYRYWKSKLQTGCKPGCDVLTTYDGKYVVFTSERGLVALTSQEFMATTEQAITYLSDAIYSIFQEYITDSNSANEIKLFKQAYWIIAYKQDSKKMFILDVRNNSWWVFTLLYNTTKLIKYYDDIDALLNHNMYDFDKSEVNYYDNDGTKHKIHWFIKSQKLHFNATNYYKHIVNMTFISVHDKTLLENATFNASSLDCKLQINSYRKQLDGNIGNDNEYTVVEYDIESARTYVQRLNYSKVNEFQYLLSDNEETAISARIPLSLNNITVKYKIGTQVR